MSVPLRAVVVAIVIHTLWGGNPVAVKLGLEVFPPMWSAFVRFTLGIACVSLWAWWRGIALWPARHEWRALIGLSLLFALQIGTMNIGFDLSSGAMSAILIATNPLFAALAAHYLIRGDRLTFAKAAGLGIAFAGVLVALVPARGFAVLALAWGNLIVLGSAAILGARLVLAARVLQRVDEVRVVVWQMLLSLPLFACGGLAWETIAWERLDWAPLAGLAYQGVVIAGLGFMVVASLSKRYPPSVIFGFNFVSPISGVALSAWLLGEPITALVLVALVCVGAGLVLLARAQQGPP